MTAASLRGGASTLFSQRLDGAIGTWKVSFEFLDNEVVIHDEQNNGAVAGKGTWKHQGKALTIQTTRALFQGPSNRTESVPNAPCVKTTATPRAMPSPWNHRVKRARRHVERNLR